MADRRSTARRLAATLAALATLGALVAVAPNATVGAETEPDPVLLVHGYRGDPSTWADMQAMFAAADASAGRPARPVLAIDLASEDNVRNAAQIRDFIAGQGWSRVDLVGQSMGGLSSRHFIKFLTSAATVDTYVSLGTPQYGIRSACVLPQSYGGQMCPSSKFLKNLNAGDDTPGSAWWTTIYSLTDGLVPTSSSRLDGGACHVEVPGPEHNSMDNDPTIFGFVLRAVERDCGGTFR